MAILEAINLKKSFGAQEVLKGINFEMDKGEVVVIIGSSGSGKTTLLRCLNFLRPPTTDKLSLTAKLFFDGASDKKTKKIQRPSEKNGCTSDLCSSSSICSRI
ncbi:MAG: ATP-binding cassette domain-containing protein [Clostridiales bacterium]|nr:MAG: ATP-binding cassette domain-containing protein [Clostridiales bacterium]